MSDPNHHLRAHTPHEGKANPSKSKLRHFLHQHYKRFIVGFSVFVVLTAITLLLQPLANQALLNKRAELIQASTSIQLAIDQTPSPTNITFSQPNSTTRSITTTTTEQHDAIQTHLNQLSIRWRDRLFAWVHISTSYSQTTKLQREMRRYTASAPASLATYATSLSALLRFFEYSPATDFLEYDPTSTDTQERLRRLNSGLDAVADDLAMQDTELSASLLPIINQAQDAAATLQQTNDVDSFVQEFSQLQEQAREILTDYYDDAYPVLRTDTIQINRSIQKVF